MDRVAWIVGNTLIYWNSLILTAAAATAICFFLGLYGIRGKNPAAGFIAVPLCIVFSVALGRLLHWYCRADSYESLFKAMTDYSQGSYALTGVFIGCLLAALLLRLIGLSRNLGQMLDCMSVAGAAGIAVGRLASFFDSSDRGQIVESMKSLPWVYPVVNRVSDSLEYRLATFAIQAMVAGGLFLALICFYTLGKRRKDGDTCLIFLLCYGASQVVLDSTRYDSLYFRSNGFVSVVQVLCAITIAVVTVIFSIRMVKNRGFQWWYLPVWIGWLGLIGGAGYMEYYVQRHGNQAAFAYGVMSVCLAAAVFVTLCIRQSGENRKRKTRPWVAGIFGVGMVFFLAACFVTRPEPTVQPQTETVQPETETTQPETETTTVPETTAVPETAPTTIPTEAPKQAARQITEGFGIYLAGKNYANALSDEMRWSKLYFRTDQTLRIESEQPFSALYFVWETLPGAYTIQWNGGTQTCGGEGFLHDYVLLPEAVTAAELTVQGEGPRELCDLSLFTAGDPPETVQAWLPPCENADILVFPTHSDDDVLFFGSLISLYAIERGARIQTAFMVNHSYETARDHERLDGLWELGVRHYPIVGEINDQATHIGEQAGVLYHPDVLAWQVEQLRRFRPLVAVGHDLNGEYGHTQHKQNAHSLTQAIEAAGDPAAYTDSAQRYGVWETPKLYLHLYEEGSFLLDVNTPLSNDPLGRTPFEIAKSAYKKHVSQQQYYFQVLQDGSHMDCRMFGLYRSLVGKDQSGDLLEHIDAESLRK